MDRRELLLEIGRDVALAHEVIFAERHGDPTPRFHVEEIEAWHSDHPQVLTVAFRGSSKTTRAEEALCIEAAMGGTTNIVVLKESETRAIDTIRAIKFEFENNEMLQAAYGVGPGSMWGDKKIVLSNGVMIQGYGRGQSLRGVKHLNARPGLIFCDDLENEETVLTPAQREKTMSWFLKTVVGALDPKGRIRVAGTPLDPDAFLPRLAKDPGWKVMTFPIEARSPAGARIPTWPERFPLEWIDATRDKYLRQGKNDAFMQEFMCQAVDPSTRVFLPEYFRHVPREPSWHAVYAVYDPARTVKATSATTGKVVFSWIGQKLVVWEAEARKWLPNELVDDVFRVNESFNPVLVAVEETGLSEWIMQPLRTEQVKRGALVPLRAINAPKGKLDFIRGLQPFFRAGQVEFAGVGEGLELLKQQLLGFPTGDIDAPNALAYALTLQPQQPVYDAFDGDVHIADPLLPLPNTPYWLACNATATITTAVLCQVSKGEIRVLCDWMREGDPGVNMSDIVGEARLECQAPGLRLAAREAKAPNIRFVAPVEHWSDYDTVGMRAAASHAAIELQRGGDGMRGREELREAMTHSAHGMPAFNVSPRASWTLRALTGGYAYRARKGELDLTPGPYSTLMLGMEAFAGLLRGSEAVDTGGNYSYTPEGRKYLSALAR
jgi:hypothetical protein